MGAKRTAFGTFGGVFRNTTATELQTAATVAALKEAGVAPEKVDSIVVGQVMTVSTRQPRNWCIFHYTDMKEQEDYGEMRDGLCEE